MKSWKETWPMVVFFDVLLVANIVEDQIILAAQQAQDVLHLLEHERKLFFWTKVRHHVVVLEEDLNHNCCCSHHCVHCCAHSHNIQHSARPTSKTRCANAKVSTIGVTTFIVGYGHTAQKAPLPIRTAKLSCARRC